MGTWSGTIRLAIETGHSYSYEDEHSSLALTWSESSDTSLIVSSAPGSSDGWIGYGDPVEGFASVAASSVDRTSSEIRETFGEVCRSSWRMQQAGTGPVSMTTYARDPSSGSMLLRFGLTFADSEASVLDQREEATEPTSRCRGGSPSSQTDLLYGPLVDPACEMPEFSYGFPSSFVRTEEEERDGEVVQVRVMHGDHFYPCVGTRGSGGQATGGISLSFDLEFTPGEPPPETVTAVADWEMRTLIEDENNDGLIDALYTGGNRTSDVPEDGRYPVVFDGCGSVGAESFTWQFGDEDPVVTGACRLETTAPEGLTTLTLTASGAGGSDTSTILINPLNLLVVSLGDSFASGEGVPRKKAKLSRNVLWDDKACHRSAHAGPARAALSLEERDRSTSVTLIHLACSGATLNKGVLGPYPDPPGKGQQLPQVTEALDLLNGQEADAITVSLGGNDIGFASVIGTCARYRWCPVERRRNIIELDDRWWGNKSLHAETQDKLKAVPGRYRRLNACLTGVDTCAVTGADDVPLGVEPGDVFITEYPSLAKNHQGKYCDGALRPPLPSGIADEEFAWADKVVLRGKPGQKFKLDTNLSRDPVFNIKYYGLNHQVARARSLGWRPVTGIYSGSVKHGYCSKSNWVVQIDESLGGQGDQYGTMHPNIAGHQNYARAISSALVSHLGL